MRCRIVLLRNDLICDYNLLCVCVCASVLAFVPSQLMLHRDSGTAQAVPRPCSLFPLLYLSPPSHLIAFDKCPYWLHIIRCSGGSLRLYYSAHTAQLFSILHVWHTRFCKDFERAGALSAKQLHQACLLLVNETMIWPHFQHNNVTFLFLITKIQKYCLFYIHLHKCVHLENFHSEIIETFFSVSIICRFSTSSLSRILKIC